MCCAAHTPRSSLKWRQLLRRASELGASPATAPTWVRKAGELLALACSLRVPPRPPPVEFMLPESSGDGGAQAVPDVEPVARIALALGAWRLPDEALRELCGCAHTRTLQATASP